MHWKLDAFLVACPILLSSSRCFVNKITTRSHTWLGNVLDILSLDFNWVQITSLAFLSTSTDLAIWRHVDCDVLCHCLYPMANSNLDVRVQTDSTPDDWETALMGRVSLEMTRSSCRCQIIGQKVPQVSRRLCKLGTKNIFGTKSGTCCADNSFNWVEILMKHFVWRHFLCPPFWIGMENFSRYKSN